jgi:ATP-dependent DNA ligase
MTPLASIPARSYGAGMEWRTPRRPVRLPTGFIEPCNPTFSTRAPSGRHWIHEIKHDGYRLIVRKDGRLALFWILLSCCPGVCRATLPS